MKLLLILCVILTSCASKYNAPRKAPGWHRPDSTKTAYIKLNDMTLKYPLQKNHIKMSEVATEFDLLNEKSTLESPKAAISFTHEYILELIEYRRQLTSKLMLGSHEYVTELSDARIYLQDAKDTLNKLKAIETNVGRRSEGEDEVSEGSINCSIA